jgi:ankyrin repeat protein
MQADIGARTRDGDTALHQAVFGSHTRCVMHLLEGYGDVMVVGKPVSRQHFGAISLR